MRIHPRVDLRLVVLPLSFLLLLSAFTFSATAQGERAGAVRTYYIAADELDWNYAPSGLDMMMGMAPEGYAKAFLVAGPHTIGRVYRKALYREYTDATFKHLKPRPERDAYLGALGPTIHAEVGDTIKVVFMNHGTHPYSLHPHGVFYKKASEGSPYVDGVADSAKGGAAVAPGKTFTYVWEVPERAGPGPADGSSIVWLYHSHANERFDVNAGLIGAIVITRKGMARPDGTPKDVDREFVTLYMIYDENESWFINDNIRRFVKDKKKFSKFEAIPKDPENGNLDVLIGTGIGPLNFRDTINGYQYANMPMPRMKVGDHVRWYVISMGEAFNFHTPHWHGNTVLVNGARTDVLNIGPAQMITADMIPDNPGIWMVHCHISDHMEGGMVARYQVSP
jgi:FtsP/CotA-like multicopper oxidase with cupredoxin domain